jgi:3-oxoacyl-[acyl-carrier protein] reductase
MDPRKVALVTGASRGIGRGLVERFLADGYRVVGCSRGEAPAADDDYEHTRLDVAEEGAVRRWIGGVARSHGRIDVVVNNAGVLATSPALVTPASTAEEVMRTNFLGAFLVSREAAKVMIRTGYGRIVNIASMACGAHMEGASAYAASKGAVIEYSKVLAKELSERNVTVNVVAPSIVETEMLDKLGEEGSERSRRALTIKRNCTVEEIAHVVAFLASPHAGCLTGQVLYLGLVV